MKRYFLVFIILLSTCNLQLYSQNNFYDINTIQEVRITFKEHNWRNLLDSLFQNFGEEGRLEGEVSINGKEFPNIGVRYKGFSSYDSEYIKNPFNIDLDFSIENRNYEGYKKLKLSNIIHDPSFIREVLSYEIARKYMPASKANFANVYINDTLIGLYTNVEAVDKSFIFKHFNSKDSSFFKGSPEHLVYPFGQNANLAYTHGIDTTGYKAYYKNEADHSCWEDLLKFIYILNNQTDSIESILNVDRTLWMHAFNYVLLNLDSYIGYSQNYYIYKDDNGKFNPILWDLNMSFGSFRHTDATSLNLSIAKMKQLNPLQLLYSTPYTPRPLIKNLLQNTTYRKMYIAHMRTIINENFKNNEYFIRGQQIQSIIDNYVQNDTNKFYSYSDFTNNLSTDVGTTADRYPGIKDLMEARVAYLDTFPGFNGYPSISKINHFPERPVKGKEIWITTKISKADSIILAYRFSSKDIFKKMLMLDDGNHNDSIAGDSIFGAKITLAGDIFQYYIYAENDSAGIFSPERAEYEYYTIYPMINSGELVINEIMSSNNNISTNQTNSSNNWIELYNNTHEDICLNGLYLSDDSSNLSKWQFPDTIVKSNSYMIIWADDDNSLSEIHSNFNLSNKGGQIILSYNNNTIIDSIIYSQEVSSKTIGRYPNGIGSFVYMIPTFSKHNFFGTSNKSDFIIFPNPATDKIYVEIENNNNPLVLTIFNSNGQTLISEQYDFNKNLMQVITKEVDISNFCKSIYYIKIVCKEKVIIKKFVISSTN